MTMRLKLLACKQFDQIQNRAESILVRKAIVLVMFAFSFFTSLEPALLPLKSPYATAGLRGAPP